MHIHLGILPALVTFAYVLIIGFFYRFIAMKFHDTAIGQAMAFAY